MKRGDVVLAAVTGDYGKPRPYVVVQGQAMAAEHPSVILCPITSFISTAPFRMAVAPGASSGLRTPSEVMVDKIVAVQRARIGERIGQLDKEAMSQLDGLLALVLGLRG